MAKAKKPVLTEGDASADVAGEARPDNQLTDAEKHELYGTALPEEPVVTNEFTDPDADVETLPTVEEARVMFDERPGLAQVLTDAGTLNRDGSFSGPPVVKRLTLDGRYVEVTE